MLLRDLAGHIDRSVDRSVGDRARDLLALGDEQLARAVCPDAAEETLRGVRSPERKAELDEALDSSGCWSACRHEPGFPAAFDSLGDAAPVALFGAGDLTLLAGGTPERSATIVGSRRASAYGREVAKEMATLLAGTGIAVISGLALGVDSAAHEGALAGGGETIAVLGAGPDRAYPRSHHRLHRRIRADGLVISELPPGSPTFRWVFPARNRLMAALGGITVVIEAAERSGSLITAEMAVESGRIVGAVPGPVTSWRSGGANRLLADGAAVVRGAQDVLDLLLGPGVAEATRVGPPLDLARRRVLAAVEGGAASADAVSLAAGSSFADTLKALGRLEREGYLRCDATGRWSRSAQQAPS